MTEMVSAAVFPMSGQRHTGFALMENEHGPCALADDEVAPQWPASVLAATVLGRSWMEARSLIVSRAGLDRRGRRGGASDDRRIAGK
jgi:hypothetical protein